MFTKKQDFEKRATNILRQLDQYQTKQNSLRHLSVQISIANLIEIFYTLTKTTVTVLHTFS
jgi:uncharacterized membrane protein YgaE (UPF0421/DUF939 family)